VASVVRKFWPSFYPIALMIGSFSLLSDAMRYIPIGTDYAVWSGIGVVGVAIIGILMFGDSATPERFAGLPLLQAALSFSSWLLERPERSALAPRAEMQLDADAATDFEPLWPTSKMRTKEVTDGKLP
jgi:multidrug transporter EmrE-like cation transporter